MQSRWRLRCSLPLPPAAQLLANGSWTVGMSGDSLQGCLAFSCHRLLYPVSSSAQWADCTVLTSHCVHWAPPPISASWRFQVRSPRGAGEGRASTGGRLRRGGRDVDAPSSLSTARTRWSPPSPGPLAPPPHRLGDPTPGETSWQATCSDVSTGEKLKIEGQRQQIWPGLKVRVAV